MTRFVRSPHPQDPPTNINWAIINIRTATVTIRGIGKIGTATSGSGDPSEDMQHGHVVVVVRGVERPNTAAEDGPSTTTATAAGSSFMRETSMPRGRRAISPWRDGP